MEDFKERLYDLLDKKNMSVEALANEIGVTKSSIYNIFKGSDPKISTIERIAETLNSSIDFLVLGHDEYKDAIEEELLALFRELSHSNKIEVVSNLTALVTKERLINSNKGE